MPARTLEYDTNRQTVVALFVVVLRCQSQSPFFVSIVLRLGRLAKRKIVQSLPGWFGYVERKVTEARNIFSGSVQGETENIVLGGG